MPHLLETAPARRSAAFVANAARAALERNEAAIRATLVSPRSHVDPLDARAALIEAGRSNVLDVPRLAGFAAALERVATALAGGASAEAAVLAEFPAPVAAPQAAPATIPLPRRRSQPPRTVARRRYAFSPSALNTYAACERRWYYRYVCNAVADEGSSASFYGSAFHLALEEFHREHPRGDRTSFDDLAARLDGWILTAFERFREKFDTAVEYELLRRRARRTARRYVRWFVDRAQAAPFEVVAIEQAVALSIEGYDFTGFIDRVDRADATGNVAVIDYKTGAIAENAYDYRGGIESGEEFQLPFYFWARTLEGDRVTRLALVPLKDAHGEVVPLELEVVPTALQPGKWSSAQSGTIGIDALERSRAAMVAIARRLTDEPVEQFDVTADAEKCAYCAYLAACRRRPARAEMRFGR